MTALTPNQLTTDIANAIRAHDFPPSLTCSGHLPWLIPGGPVPYTRRSPPRWTAPLPRLTGRR